MLDASMAPVTAPAPTRVCSSSTKRMTLPSFSTSESTPLNLSSNSPRCEAPAMSKPRSRLSTRLPRSVSGTSLSFTFCASPSTIAVFPTPGSPIRTGLFFVRRERISMALRVSLCRPITGSSFPSLAIWVRSTVYFFRFSPWGKARGSTQLRPCWEEKRRLAQDTTPGENRDCAVGTAACPAGNHGGCRAKLVAEASRRRRAPPAGAANPAHPAPRKRRRRAAASIVATGG
mmetsp:Transcript_10644/g.26058  ORF Transcript_10644/g.26058 Transcript_10644/m.26058 type:complete len:231 (+) Transcript_10644:438-1130(+)